MAIHWAFGAGSLIGAGALIPPNMIIPENSLVVGSPGKVVRDVKAVEKEMISMVYNWNGLNTIWLHLQLI